MAGRLTSLFFYIAILLCSNAVLAEQDDQPPSDEFIINAWSDPADCNRSNAKPVLFSALVTDYKAMDGECIMVEGYWRGRALFGSAGHAKSHESVMSERLRGKRVGLYARWEIVGKPPQKPTRMRIVGRVGNCQTQWPNAIMVMGYCHYTGGPILLVADAFSA